MVKDNKTKQLERISKKIFLIRVAMGYATKTQREEGWEEEMKTVKYLLKEAKVRGEVGCGGFTYTPLKNGKIRITPDFSFLFNNNQKGGK